MAGRFVDATLSILVIWLMPGLAGCATWRPPPLPADHVPVEYFSKSPVGVEATIGEMTASDGVRLAYTIYRRSEGLSGVVLIYLHGIESHGGWFKGVAELLALAGYDVYCLDRRGSGINREPRGLRSGDIDHWRTWLSDVRDLRTRLAGQYRELHLIGLSWGGKQAVAYAISNPRDFASLILVTPGIRSRVKVGWRLKMAVAIGSIVFPTKGYELPLEPEMFTHAPVFQAKIRKDPLRLKHVTLRFIRNNARLDRLVDRRIESELVDPVLLLLAGNDPIIDNEEVLNVLGRGHQKPYEVGILEDQIHSIQFDAVDEMVERIDRWIRDLKCCRGESGGGFMR